MSKNMDESPMAPSDPIRGKALATESSSLDDAMRMLESNGAALIRQVLPKGVVEDLRRRADTCYQRIEAVALGSGPKEVSRVLSSRHRYLATSSSVALEALGEDVVPRFLGS